MPAPAFNYRISEIEAALGVPQLRRFDELYEAYARIARGYTERLAGIVTASWDVFAEVVANAPPALRKGPRGGGRFGLGMHMGGGHGPRGR